MVKQEPADYSWDDFVREGRAAWTGVRNYQARNHLRAMRRGDLVLFYHSGTHKSLVGLARVEREAYVDPTATEGDWVCVDLVPVGPLRRPVELATVKAEAALCNLALVRQSRLSVLPVTPAECEHLLRLALTPCP
jgi:predicted RNA-binding protein with PUA-like domain